MAKLPTALDLGVRVPQNQGQVVTGNLDTSGYQDLGNALQKVGGDIQSRQDAMNMQLAQTMWQKAKIEADNTFAHDNDFATIPKRYNEALTKAKEDALKQVTNPYMKKQLSQNIDVSQLQGAQQIQALAFQKEKDTGIATLENILSTNRENALSATSDADRTAALNQMNSAITTAQNLNYIDKAHAESLRIKTGQDMAVAMVGMQDLRKQRDILSSGDGYANIIPSDVRKSMLEKVNNRLVIQEGTEAADQIRAAGGDRTERLNKVREIKDPDVRQAAQRQVEHDLGQEELAKQEIQYSAYQDLAKQAIDGQSINNIIQQNPDKWDLLSAEQQSSLLKSNKNKETNLSVYNTLNQLASENRDAAYSYFMKHAQELSVQDQKTWSDRLSKPQELDGFLTRTQRLDVALSDIGFDDKKSKQYKQAQDQLDQDVMQFEQDNGRKPNAKELDTLISGITKLVEHNWLSRNVYGFDVSPENRYYMRAADQKINAFQKLYEQVMSDPKSAAALKDKTKEELFQAWDQQGLLDAK